MEPSPDHRRSTDDAPGSGSPIWSRRTVAARPPLAADRRVEVAVVGGGIVGLTTALLLARAGRSVALLEARRIGDGTTGRSTAKVSLLQGDRYRLIAGHHGPEAASTYARAQIAAFDWIEEQVRTRSIACDWERRSAVTYATTEAGARRVDEEIKAATEAGLAVRPTSEVELPFPVTSAAVLDDQAQFSPRRYLDALAEELESLPGATVHEDTRATAVRGVGSPHVVTAHATVRADHVVVATLLPITDRSLSFARATPRASHVVAVRIDGEPPRDQSISVDEPIRSLRTARLDGREVMLVGGEGSVLARGPRPSEAVRRLEDWARLHFSVTEVVAAWSAHDLVPVDHLPWVGPTSPITPRVLMATGFEKWGITMGTAAAQLLAGQILGEDDGATRAARKLFHPGRIPAGSLPEVAGLNLAVARRLVSDWVRPAPVRAVCTHLGGVCRWNDLDRTWDCPLHGSRFEADGTVLAGPAVRPLSEPPPPPRSDDG